MPDPVAPTPASVDPDDVGRDHGPRGHVSRWQKGVGAVGLVVVLWVGYDSTLVRAWFDDDTGTMDHMPDGMDHGPGGDVPPPDRAEDPDQSPPTGGTEDDDHAPPDGGQGDHDSGQWDH